MRKFIVIGCLAVSLLSLNSCYVNRHYVGDDAPQRRAATKVYSHAKQVYLFWGLIAVGNPHPATPTECGYQIKSAYNGVDMLINLFTGGIVGTRNIKILVNKDSKCDPAVKRLQNKVDKAKLKKELKENK
jgi:hypothetical protein